MKICQLLPLLGRRVSLICFPLLVIHLFQLLDYGDHPGYSSDDGCCGNFRLFPMHSFCLFYDIKSSLIKFAAINCSLSLNIGLNLFSYWCLWLNVHCPSTISWFYDPDYLVGYILLATRLSRLFRCSFYPGTRGVCL